MVDCNCDLKKYREQDYVMQFLMGLNECYLVIKMQILLMDPLPPLNHVFSMVLQYERQNGLDEGDQNQVDINAADGNRFYKGKNSGGKVCTYCGKTWHTIESCFRKHSFPLASKPKGYGSAVNNITGDGDDPDEKLEGGYVSKKNSPVSGLANEECRTLLNLLQKTNIQRSTVADPQSVQVNQACVGSPIPWLNEGTDCAFSCSIVKGNQLWIMDSEVTGHICTSMDWFESYRKINHIPESLPNGSVVMAQLAGDVKFSDTLILRYALFLPEFNINLVSISKLTKAAQCNLISHLLKMSVQFRIQR